MNAIYKLENIPPFLRVNDSLPRESYNRFFPIPYKEGEIVKPSKNQMPEIRTGNPIIWKKHYVRFARKQPDGTWKDGYVEQWIRFDKITKK